MFQHIYNLIAMSNIIIIFVLIARYIFFLPEPKNKKTTYAIIFLWIIFGIIGEFFVEEDTNILIQLLVIGGYFAYCNKGHRIKGFFLLFPVMGLCYGFLVLIMVLPTLIPNITPDTYDTILAIFDIYIFILLMLFLFFGKNWRIKYKNEMQYRKLKDWERFMLNSIGILLLVSVIFIVEYIEESNSFNVGMHIMIISVISEFLSFTLVAMILQSNKRAYFNGIAELNERYLNAEVAHFNAYQKTQIETRRIRHDMKNHLLSLEHFLNEGDLEAAKDYLKSIGVAMEHIDTELHTGNTLADAICNEKNRLAEEKGINLVVEGIFPENISIKNVDLCTILANSLDNAIEATENLEEQQKWIKLKIKVQGNMLFLSFSNPTKNTLDIKMGKTTKKDSLNHGFGLQNIKLAIQKYHGEMNIEIKEANGEEVFFLEIMLVLSK